MARTEIEIIKDGKIVEADLSTGCVSADKLANDAVVTAKIKDNQVTQAKLAADISFFPIGGIIMWSGQVSNIPSGWKLCDGNNGTPDLRGRFIVGASASGGYDPGATGGSNEVTLTEAHLTESTDILLVVVRQLIVVDLILMVVGHHVKIETILILVQLLKMDIIITPLLLKLVLIMKVMVIH